VVRPAAQVQGGLFADDAAPAVAVPELATSADCIYTLVNTDEQFQAMLAELRQQRRFCFDTETTSLGAVSADLVGLSLSWKPQTGWYVPVKGPAGCTHLDCERVLESLKPIFEDPSIRKVGHNLKYDTLVLRQHGIDVCGLSMDSMVAAFLLDSGRLRYGIDDLARDLLRFGKIPTEALIGRGRSQITMDRVELEKIACYAAEDADIALRLCDLLEARLDEVPTLRRLADEVEIPLIPVLAEMEHNGIAIDPAVLAEQSRAMGERVDQLRAQIQEQAGREFNPDSPRQLAEVLFERLRLKVIKRTKTGPSTDVEVLERLAAEHPVPRLVLEYRSLIKLKNTYLDNLTQYQDPRTGRIHTSFNQTGAATGRLSSSDPNLQNIPIRTDEGRRIRLAFVPGERQRNVLLTADYSQIELRVLAHFTQEPALLEAFERDQDIHRAVAAEVFGVPLDSVTRDQRGQAKVINFGIIYGVSAYGLARRIEGLSLDAAGDLIRAYNRRFPAIRRFLESCVMDAQAHGYVQTILGRRRAIPDINSAVLSVRNGAERMAINSVVQGSAADLIKVAMVHLHERLRSQARPSRMLLQVHDELVLETPEDQVQADADIVREEMIAAGRRLGLSVPLKVEVGWGKNWQEVK
jgi:DNA polymerase-1